MGFLFLIFLKKHWKAPKKAHLNVPLRCYVSSAELQTLDLDGL